MGVDACDSEGRIGGMGRGGRFLCVIVLLGGCQTAVDDLGLLEEETIRFKDQNEGIRVEDLMARYEKRRKRADALSDQLLQLQQEKERAYVDYDKLRGDLAKVERDRATAERSREAAASALRKAKQETARLKTELAKERRAIDGLEAELKKLQARVNALEAKKSTAAATE